MPVTADGTSIERRVGRLVEIRTSESIPKTLKDDFVQRMRPIFADDKVVVISDYRATAVFTDSLSDWLKSLMVTVNVQVLRAAAVMPPGAAVLNLQYQRISSSAGNPNRRAFQSPDDAVAWLSPALTEAEIARVSAFLAEFRAAPGG